MQYRGSHEGAEEGILGRLCRGIAVKGEQGLDMDKQVTAFAEAVQCTAFDEGFEGLPVQALIRDA